MKFQSHLFRSIVIFIISISLNYFSLGSDAKTAPQEPEHSEQKLYKNLIKYSLTKERGILLLRTAEQITYIEEVILNRFSSSVEIVPKTEFADQIKRQISTIDAFLNLWRNENYAVFRTSEKESLPMLKALSDYKVVATAYLNRENSGLPGKERFETKLTLKETLFPFINYLRSCNRFSANLLNSLQKTFALEYEESEKAAFLLRKTLSIQASNNQKPERPNLYPIKMEIRFFQNLFETDQFEKEFIVSLEEFMLSAENNATELEPFKSKTRERFVQQLEKLKVRFKSPIEGVKQGTIQTVDNAIKDAIEEDRLTFIGKEGGKLLHVGNEATPYSGFLKTNYEHKQVKKLLSIHKGRVHGATIMWHECGQIKGRVHWKNGKPNGSMLAWDNQGKLLQEGFWQDGKVIWTTHEWDHMGRAINKNHVYNSPSLNQATKQTLLEKSKSDDFFQDWIEKHHSDKIQKHHKILENLNLEALDLQNLETRKRILKKAVVFQNLQMKEQKNERILFENDIPFTGWVKIFSPTIHGLAQVKKGKRHGVVVGWYPSGQKHVSEIWSEGEILSSISWKPSGEMCLITGVEQGKGVTLIYDEEGKVFKQTVYHNGREINQRAE